MPFQPINYANISPQGDPAARGLGDAFSNMFNTARSTYQLMQDAETQKLQNALNQLKLQYAPQEYESQEALKKAQIQQTMQEVGKNKMMQNIINGRPPNEGLDQFYGQQNQQMQPIQNQVNPEARDLAQKIGQNLIPGISPPQALGMEGAPRSQQAPESEQIQSSNYYQMSPEEKNIMVRKFMGIPGELPSEKYAAEQKKALAEINAKADAEKALFDYKNSNKPIPEKNRADFTKEITQLNGILPMLDKLKQNPSSHPANQYNPLDAGYRRYDNIVNLSKESLLGSMTLPRIQKTYGDLDKALRRAPNETQNDYNARIEDIKDILKSKYDDISYAWKDAPTLRYKDPYKEQPPGQSSVQNSSVPWQPGKTSPPPPYMNSPSPMDKAQPSGKSTSKSSNNDPMRLR